MTSQSHEDEKLSHATQQADGDAAEPAKDGTEDEKQWGAYLLPIGLSLGVTFGIIFDQLALGISLGLCFGALAGLIKKK